MKKKTFTFVTKGCIITILLKTRRSSYPGENVKNAPQPLVSVYEKFNFYVTYRFLPLQLSAARLNHYSHMRATVFAYYMKLLEKAQSCGRTIHMYVCTKNTASFCLFLFPWASLEQWSRREVLDEDSERLFSYGSQVADRHSRNVLTQTVE